MNYGQLIAHGFIRKPISAAVATATASATASAAAAAVSAERAVTAWAFASEPAEAIAGKSQILHQGTIVASCIDMPSKHSDGGAWIDRCQGLSWYNETLGGTNWLNTRCGSEAIARAVIQSAAMPEKVTNGTFTSDTSEWTSYQSGSLSANAGRLLITNGAADSGGAYQHIATVIGRTYVLSVSITEGTSTTSIVRAGVGVGSTNYVNAANSGDGTFTFSFNATTTTTTVTVYTGSVTLGQTVYFDNISVKEVDTAVSAAGYVYQSTADNKFYSLTGSSGQSEVFRGIKREYPRAGVAWIAESARVVGYDLGSGAMWMVFTGSNTTVAYTGVGSLTSIAAGNGWLFFGSGYALSYLSFMHNAAVINQTASPLQARNTWATDLSQRNAGGTAWVSSRNILTATGIVNNAVNSVAITVLPNAPIDPATGLPVPTIAVATAGGVSVILDSGSVVNGGTLTDYKRIHITPQFDLICDQGAGSGGIRISRNIGSLGSGFTQTQVYYAGSVPSLLGGTSYPTGLSSKTGDLYVGETTGAVFVKEHPTTPASGMVAYVTEKYNTGWQVGAIKGAYLADTTAETVTASGELVTNGTFATDTTGWSAGNATLSVVSGALRVTCVASGYCYASQAITCVVGKTYVATVNVVAEAKTGDIYLAVGVSLGSTAFSSSTAVTGTLSLTFVAVATTQYISVAGAGTTLTGETIDFDNISVKLAEPDRSVKGKGLIVNGSLTKTAVASGAGLVAYSGFSAANYLEQPYNSDLDFGTGDFAVYGWATPSSLASLGYLFGRQNSGATGSRIYAYVAASTGVINFTTTDGTTSVPISGGAITANSPAFIVCMKSGASVFLYVNAVQVATATAPALTLANATAVLRLGIDHLTTYPFLGSLALWRISATAPSADQIAQIYRDELPLFQTNAQCTLAGTSPAITCQDWDDETGVLHVGTSYGRSSFKGLLRVESEATTVGTPTSISSRGGHIVMGGTSAKLYTPAKYLRDELQRQSEAKKALGRIPVFLDFTATSGQTAFVATKGYRIQAVYKGGTLMRESTTGTYWTRSNDGYQETATLSVGATTGDWISMMLTRI